MTTILDYRPEVAEALADGSLVVGLSQDTLDSLQRINEAIEALVAPLTRVESLSEAEALAANSESEYLRLAEEWSALLVDSDFSMPDASEVDSTLYDLHLPNVDDQEQWLGTLQSAHAYLEWAKELDRRLDSTEKISQQELLRLDAFFSVLHGPWGRYVMTRLAMRLVLANSPSSSPHAIPFLTRLADLCMTEVEDMFLAEADYGEDDGQTVLLADVRADLGL